MTIDDRLLRLRELEGRVSEMLDNANAAARLKGGGGDGTSSGMEMRVARLETAVEGVKKEVGDLRIDFARFDERSKHFPTKGFIFSVCLGLLAATSGIVALIVRFLPAAS